MSTEPKYDGAARDAAPPGERLLAPLVKVGGAISTALILVTLALTTYSVFMRYVMGMPPTWIDQMTGFLLVAMVMFGVSEAYRRGDHIAIDLLTANLSSGMARLRAVWSEICVLAFSVVLILSTWEAIHFSMDFGAYTSGAIEVASWIPQLPMLIGGVLLALMAIARLIAIFSRRQAQ